MFLRIHKFSILIVLSFFACKSQQKLAQSPAKPFVVLKLDDLWYEDGLVHPGWLQVVAFLDQEKVIGTIGLICESLEEGDDAYFKWIKQRAEDGYEIWHHGFCHCKPMINGVEQREFRGTDSIFQIQNLKKAQQLADEKLGITFRSFGAPYNATDEFTALALTQIPDIKVWMYKTTPAQTNKFTLNRIPDVNIEYPVHIPDFEKFKAGYHQFKEEPILVIQGHPRSWVDDPSRFEQFKQIIHFLKAEGVRFITPYAYYQIQN